MTVMQPSEAFVPLLPGAAPTARRPVLVDASLIFRQRGGPTFIGSQLTPHPFHVTRPFYRPGDPAGMATLYLQSSSGGLYGDDQLGLRIVAEAGARAHVTSQASTMVPASHGGRARLGTRLRVEAGATLEYVPDPLILFEGADAETTLDVSMAKDAIAIVADAVLLHNPGGGMPTSGSWMNTITLTVDGERLPRFVERQRLDLGDRLAFGLPRGDGSAARLCYGALYWVGPDTTAAAAALSAGFAALGRASRPRSEAGWLYWGVNALPAKGIVGARFLCGDGATLGSALEAAWSAARVATGAARPARRRK